MIIKGDVSADLGAVFKSRLGGSHRGGDRLAFRTCHMIE